MPHPERHHHPVVPEVRRPLHHRRHPVGAQLGDGLQDGDVGPGQGYERRLHRQQHDPHHDHQRGHGEVEAPAGVDGAGEGRSLRGADDGRLLVVRVTEGSTEREVEGVALARCPHR